MPLVHQQREQTDQRLQENRDDILLSRNQMQELVHSIEELSTKVSGLNTDKKDRRKVQGGGG